MKNTKRTIIIILILFLISLFSVAIILFIDQGEEEPNNNLNNTQSEVIINKEIEILKVKSIYFDIQNTINYYYTYLKESRVDKLMNILEPNYILENNINRNNINEKINSNYDSVSYIATNIYYNPNSTVTYYFVNGYVFNASMTEDYYTYLENINYLIITKDNNFYIRPLEDNIDLENYAKTYNIKDIDIKNNESLLSINVSRENMLSMYINEFKNLLFLDTEKAYEMLDDETKNKYKNYNDFESKSSSIYNNLTSTITGIIENNNEEYTEYKVIDKNNISTKITEYYVMNYKIGY